ncbi:hypothetical protein DPMN_086101 [Dreissena polymorpha]|uniref:Uncharacterized protein n=1 Tax=Dreissena polymorpha TaxID=45954 RepID=A0A9D3YH96_DREPO|nr:hypothetical protein DPMN_086101 [Dreissena polymorpha]
MVGSTAAKTAANVAKTVASKVSNASKTEIGKTAIEAGKSVVKEVGLKAIDVGKDVAIAKAKALFDGYNAPKKSRNNARIEGRVSVSHKYGF